MADTNLPQTAEALRAAHSLAAAGRLHEARRIAEQSGIEGLKVLIVAAETVGAAAWLKTNAPTPDLRSAAADILVALGKLAPTWPANPTPYKLLPEAVPTDRESFNRLFVGLVGRGGFYHPVELPGLNEQRFTFRSNRRSDKQDFYPTEYALVRGLLSEHFPEGLAGRSAIDFGPCDGFFTARLAAEGVRVLAPEKMLLMAIRTAVISSLLGLTDRVIVRNATLDTLEPKRGEAHLDGGGFILALGLIYHLPNLVAGLEKLIAPRVPVVLEYQSFEPGSKAEAAFDPKTHGDRRPVATPWLTEWLEARGFKVKVEPRWRAYCASHSDVPDEYDMMIATPV
jgi:hypothetical protein